MRIRPRLLIASLALAVAVVAMFAWTQRPAHDDERELDARLSDPLSVVTYPNAGLGNADVTGRPFPSVALAGIDDREITSDQLLGEPLVVNLWYSTCAPCAKELPEFATVDAETDRVRFVGINLHDSLEVMQRFAGERGVAYDLYRDVDAGFTDAVRAAAFPVTLFVTSDGTIVEQTGVLNADQLRARVADLLAADPAA